MLDSLAAAGAPVDRCCRIVGVARQNYYKAKRTPTSPTQLRRQWLTGLIREVHVAPRGTHGYRRIHAELTMAMGIKVCSRTISVLMTLAGIRGLPASARVKNLRGVVTAGDLVNRKFHRLRPNELWVTDITVHNTTEGRVYCAAVLDDWERCTLLGSVPWPADRDRGVIGRAASAVESTNSVELLCLSRVRWVGHEEPLLPYEICETASVAYRAVSQL